MNPNSDNEPRPHHHRCVWCGATAAELRGLYPDQPATSDAVVLSVHEAVCDAVWPGGGES